MRSLLCLLPLVLSIGLTCAGEHEFPVLLACSQDDQTASFRLADGQIVLVEAGQVLQDQITLEKILPSRIVLTRTDPQAPGQLERLWIDLSHGIEAATVQKIANLPDQRPQMIHFEPPIVIPLEGNQVPTGAQKPPR